jgi:hypothetical protein
VLLLVCRPPQRLLLQLLLAPLRLQQLPWLRCSALGQLAKVRLRPRVIC